MFGRPNKRPEKEEHSWKWLSRFAAIIMTVVYAVYVSNVVYNYIPFDSWWLNFLDTCVFYGPIVICAVTAVASVSNKGLIVRLAFLAVWVLIFLFSFFPETFYNIIY